jgi:ribosomal protein S18 acetylase RimI-like enzyme
MIAIRPLGPGDDPQPLAALLVDAVARGASVGFLAPLSEDEALAYWRGALAQPPEERLILGAFDGEALLGSIQLAFETRPNGRHRAEVQKLLVHSNARRRGIGSQLVRALETEAKRRGRTLLVLDTRLGDQAESLYRRLEYVPAGTVPRYARSSNGRLEASVFFYKELRP